MSDNEEDTREGSDEETAGDGSRQPRDPETGRFLPSDATVGSERERERTTESDDRDEGTVRNRGGERSGGGKRRSGTERDRSGGRGSRGVVTLGQPPAGVDDPTHRPQESQPVTVHLRRAETAEQRTGAAIVPPEILQTSAEREFPPWLAKPSAGEGDSDRGDDEREFWEAPVDPQEEGADLSPGRRGLERRQPERQATRQSTDPPEGAPRPWDGEPRQQPGTDPVPALPRVPGIPPFLLPGRPDAVVPALARRHQIGQWIERGRNRTRSELPPHRRPIADRQGDSGPRFGVDRYPEPQEVRFGPSGPQQHELWEYAGSRTNDAPERWEAAWSEDEPGPAERGQWGVEHAKVERLSGREGGPPPGGTGPFGPGRTERGDPDDDEMIRPGPT